MKTLNLSVLFSLIISLVGAQTNPTLMWKVQKDQKTFYIYGSYTTGQSQSFSFSDVFFEIFESSEDVYFQTTPLENFKTIKEFSNLSQLANVISEVFGNSNASNLFYNEFINIAEWQLDRLKNLLSIESSGQGASPGSLDLMMNSQDINQISTSDMVNRFSMKNDKKIHTIENQTEQVFNMLEALFSDMEVFTQKMMKQTNLAADIKNAYLEKDIGQLNQIIDEMDVTFKDLFLTDRNQKIADSIALIAKNNSLCIFEITHLCGDIGVLNLLEKQGYEVQPIEKYKTRKTDKIIRKLNSNYKQSNLEKYYLGNFSVQLPVAPMESSVSEDGYYINKYSAPDFTNKVYYEISVLPKFFKTQQVNSIIKYYQDNAYPITPGDIAQIESTNIQSFPALKIESLLKNNRFYKVIMIETPVELLILKINGPTEHIKEKQIKEVLESFYVKNTAVENNTGFSMPLYEMTSFRQSSENRKVKYLTHDAERKLTADISIHTLHDNDYIESDSFELAYFKEQLAESFETTVENWEWTPENIVGCAFTLQLDITDKSTTQVKKHCFIGLHKNQYILVLLDGDRKEALSYFEKIKINQPTYDNFEEYNDSTLYFSTRHNAPKKNDMTEQFINLAKNEIMSLYLTEQDDESMFDAKEKSTTHYINPGEYIDVVVYIANRFEGYKDPLKEMMETIKLHFAEDSYNVYLENSQFKEDNSLVFTFFADKKNSSRSIYGKVVTAGNRVYEIYSTTDSTHDISKPVQAFYDHFEATDTSDHPPITQYKGNLWVKALKDTANTDRVGEAFLSLDYIYDLKEEDIKELEDIIINHPFGFDSQNIRLQLLNLYSFLPDYDEKNKVEFFKRFLKFFRMNSFMRDQALLTLTNIMTEESVKLIKDELLKSVPGEFDENYPSNLLHSLHDSLELVQYLVPEIESMILENKRFTNPYMNLIDFALYREIITQKDISDKFIHETAKHLNREFRKLYYQLEEQTWSGYYLFLPYINFASLVEQVNYRDDDEEVNKLINNIDTLQNENFNPYYYADKVINDTSRSLEPFMSYFKENPEQFFTFYTYLDHDKHSENFLAKIIHSFDVDSLEKVKYYHEYQSDLSIDTIYNDEGIFDVQWRDSTIQVQVYHIKTEGKDQLIAVYPIEKNDTKIFSTYLMYEFQELEDLGKEKALKKILRSIEYQNRNRTPENGLNY